VGWGPVSKAPKKGKKKTPTGGGKEVEVIRGEWHKNGVLQLEASGKCPKKKRGGANKSSLQLVGGQELLESLRGRGGKTRVGTKEPFRRRHHGSTWAWGNFGT